MFRCLRSPALTQGKCPGAYKARRRGPYPGLLSGSSFFRPPVGAGSGSLISGWSAFLGDKFARIVGYRTDKNHLRIFDFRPVCVQEAQVQPEQKFEAIGMIAKLEADIIQQQKTVDSLKAAGHACPDAERELQRRMKSLSLLK
jgi:hypothetical protein